MIAPTGFEVFAAEILLRIIPDPIILGLAFLFLLGWFISGRGLPASVSGPSFLIVVFTMGQYLGGLFDLFNMLLLSVTGVILIVGIIKLGSR